jgi:hypothetical protein
MTTTATREVTAVFRKAKETPGTFKYDEVPPKGQPPVSGSLYLKKYIAEQLGDAETLTVTIKGG